MNLTVMLVELTERGENHATEKNKPVATEVRGNKSALPFSFSLTLHTVFLPFGQN